MQSGHMIEDGELIGGQETPSSLAKRTIGEVDLEGAGDEEAMTGLLMWESCEGQGWNSWCDELNRSYEPVQKSIIFVRETTMISLPRYRWQIFWLAS